MSPNPSNLDSFNHQSTKLSTGRTYHYIDQLPADYDASKTVTLLLVHGFPDLWYVFLSERIVRFVHRRWRSGLPGRIKSALGLRLVTVSSHRTCWVTVRLTNPMNLRSIRSRSSPMTLLLFSTTSVPPKPYVFPSDH